MPQLVEISGVGTVEFPDGMSRDDIRDRIQNQIIPRYRKRPAADAIPTVAPTTDPNIPEEPTSNPIADFGKRVVAGVQSGVGKTLQGAVRAADIAQDVAPVPTFSGFGGVGMPIPEAVRRVNTQIDQDLAKRSATRQERVAESLPYQLGKVVEEEAPETFGVDPKRDDEFMSKLATAAGEMFPTMAAGVVAGPAAVMAQYGAVAGEAQADEALKAGRPDRMDVAFLNAAALGGVSEALIGVPGKFWAIVKGARKAGVKPSAFQKWINANPVKGGIVKAGGEGAIRESAQEGLEQIGGNLIASDIAGYEPGRKASKGVGEAAAIGGILGGVIGAGGAGMHQTHRNLTAQALRETREGPLNLKKVADLPQSQKATVQPFVKPVQRNPPGYVAKDFTPTVQFTEETSAALDQTAEQFGGAKEIPGVADVALPTEDAGAAPLPTGNAFPPSEPTGNAFPTPTINQEPPIEESKPTIPAPDGGVISPPAGAPSDIESGYVRPPEIPQQLPPSSNPIRDLILSRHTVMEKSHMIRKMAKELGIEVKELQERIEAEIVLIAHEKASDMGMSKEDTFKELVDLYHIQPLLSARTSTSIEHQAYSTPAPLAYALRNATLTGTKTSVYDSSGGNGMLYIGSDLSKSIGNELQSSRAEALRKLGVATVTENDATTFVPEGKVSSVHVNPPFGTIPTVNYDGFAIKKLEHIIALKALEAMKDNGTAAIVLGANMNVADTAKGAQWVFENYLYSRYHVVDNFEVDGELYGKQGAKWPVRILIVAGRRATPLTGELAPKRVDRLSTWDEVWARSESARDEAKRVRESLAVDGPAISNAPTGGTDATGGPGVPAEKPSEPPQKAPGGGGSGGSGGRKPKAPKQSGGGSTPVAAAENAEGQGRPGQSDTKPGDTGKPPVGMEEGAGESEVPTDAEPAGGEKPKPRSVPKPTGVANDQQQIPYEHQADATPFGTLTPGNIGSGTHAFLRELEKRVGPIVEYVAKKIGIPAESLRSPSVMSADQIDGVAMAIYQIENGGALVIGDETGIGKGRQAAALLQYAKHQGKIPIFVTKDPKLFSDMYGDIADIGGTIKKPLIFGDPVKASIVDNQNNVLVKSPTKPKQDRAIQSIMDGGMEDSGYDAIFLTYSQVNQENNRQQFLENLTADNDAVIVMDEAHEAAGDGESSMQAAFFQGGVVKKGKGADKTQITKAGLLNKSGTKIGRGGVLYLSATYAKRPDNMPLYFRTDLRKAAQDFKQIVQAMKSGGVALQQAISEALGKAGQYLRRERDFSGVKYSMERVDSNVKGVTENVDAVTDVLRDVIAFSRVMVTRATAAADKSTAMSEDSMAMTEFASKVHNTIGQLLLAAKADAVIEKSVAASKQNEKPVIALMNTMESFLDEFVTDQGIKNGDPIKLTWGDLVKHALSRTLRASKKLPNGDTEVVIIDPESVGLKDEYDRIAKAAESLDVPFPVSPIDYIIQGIRAKGITIGELTGRESGIEYTDPQKGEGIYRTFKKADKNRLVNGFNGGDLDGLLLNASGSTGLSIHASTAAKVKDKRKRKMLIAQPSSDINVFIQTLGRIRRTGMIPGSAEYVHLILPLQAEVRPAAMTNQKMKSLNANTTAEASGSVKIEVDDILNKYGDQIVAEYLDANPDMQIATGIDITQNEDGSVEVPQDVARKFTGRMAVMRDADQAEAYSQIIPAYKELIEHLKTTGEYDLDIVVHSDWDGVLKSDTQLSAGSDDSSIFTSGVRAQQWEITDNRHVPTGEEMEAEFKRNLGSVEALEKKWSEFQDQADDAIKRGLSRAEERVAEANALPEGESKTSKVTTAEANLKLWKQKAERWRGTQLMVDRILELANKPVSISNESSGETQDGMLVNVKFPDLAKGLRISPGAFRFNYLVDAPGGKVAVSGSQFSGNKMLQTRSSKTVADFEGAKKGQRYDRWVLTGNPIAAFENTGGSGKVVRFTTREGEVVTGLLMPTSWNMSKLASDPRMELINGDAVANLYANLSPYTQVGVEISQGAVRIQKTRTGSGWGISVAVPKRVVHLDTQLREIIDSDFTKSGNRMLATVWDSTTLARAVDRIMAIMSAKFRVPGETTKGDQRAADTIAKANEAAKPKGGKWTGATGQSGFVLDPAEIIKEIKRKFKKVSGYLRLAAEDAIETIQGIRQEQFKLGKVGDYRLAKLRWVGRQQRSWQEAHDAQRDIKAIFKDPVRDEAAHAWIEAAGDPAVLRSWARRSRDPKRRAAYEAALTLTPAELDMVQAVRDTFAELGTRAEAEGMLKTFRENYVPHIWDIGSKPRRGSGRTMRDRMTHSMARTFETSFDGEQAGFEPKTKRLSEVVPIYINEMNRVIAARQFARDLRRGRYSDGEPLIRFHGVGVQVDGPLGQATLVMPDVPKNKDLKYRVLPNQPALHDWIWASKDSAGNPIFLKADMALHPEIYRDMEKILGRSLIKTWYQGTDGGKTMAPIKWLLKHLDRVQSEYKRTMLGFFATFHQVQEATHGGGHRVSPFMRPKIDLIENPVHMDYANHGLMIYPDRASENEFMEGFRNSGIVSRTPGIGQYADMYANYLFHVFIPEMKVRTMEEILKRNMEVFAKDIRTGNTTEAAVKVLSAEQTNAAYGHLNYTDLGRSPTVQHILQIAFLAPDFLEARTRFFAQAAKGAVGLKVGREQALALAFLAASQAVLAWLGAAILGGDWDWKNPFEFRVGNRKYTIRSVPEDVMSAIHNFREFVFNRINPLTGRAAMMVITGKDWRGIKITPTEMIEELAQGWIPLNIRPFVTDTKRSTETWEQWVGTMGIKISYNSATAEMFELANDWKKKSGDPKLVAEAKRNEQETHATSDYTPLRRALESGNEEKAKAEYAKLLETKSRIQVREAMFWNKPFTGSRKNELKFVESLTDEQKVQYAAALKVRRLLYDRFLKMRDGKPMVEQSPKPN